MTAALGHNKGPTMEPGHGWRTHCWTKARKSLLGHMPIEVVRAQVKRAAELGMDYKTYATVTGTSGQDIIAFLFSSNALRLHLSARELPADRVQKLAAVDAARQIVLAHRPIRPADLPPDFDHLYGIRLTDSRPAPRFTESWADIRTGMRRMLAANKIPSGGVLLVGDTSLERDWTAAGKFAGYLPAERYFTESSYP